MKRAIVLVFLTLLACGTRKDTDVSDSVTLEKTQLVLSHGNLKLSTPVDIDKVIGKDSLLVFDKRSKSLVLFDLRAKGVLWSTILQVEGPNFTDFPIYDLSLYKGRVLLLTQSYFSVYDLDGKVIYRLGKDEIPGLNADYNLWNFSVSDHDTVIFPVLLFGAVTPGKENIENEPIFIELDLNTLATRKIEVASPEETLVSDHTQGFYNSHSKHHVLAHDNSLVYHFEFSSKLYRYDLNSSKLEVFPALSANTKNLREPIPANASLEQITDALYSGPRFYGLQYDAQTQHYVRLHFEHGKDATGTIVMNSYLMLFNEDFEVVKELALEKDASVNMFVDQGKIYLWKSYAHISIEDVYEVIVYKINQG